MTATKRKTPLRLDGEMSIYTAGETKLRLMEALGRSKVLEIDLSGVTEVDTAGLQLLILAKQEAARQGKTLRYVDHSPALLATLDLCQLTARFGDPVVMVANA